MIVVDTSAWIEFLRDTGSATCDAVDDALGGDIAICEAISMEVLAGGRDERHVSQLRGLLALTTMLSITPNDYDEAAAMYRTCCRGGETVRRLVDCLIAAVAIREGASLLHADADFHALARHTALTSHPASLA
jgi:predicted nucleic acid-binding protein